MTLSPKRGPHDLAKLNPMLGGYYYRRRNGSITVPVIHSREEGRGHVRAFLDALPTDIRIEFRCVLSDVLAGALARRGFRRVSIYVPEMGDTDDDVWVRP